MGVGDGADVGAAWDAAHRAANRSGVRLAPLTSLADCDRVNAVIERVWGAQDLARELIRAMQYAGCVLIGAAGEGREELVGFVLGFGGFSEGPHLHSHMLATLPERQSAGVGYALKLAQRAAALEAGLDEIRWTYDPLLARNAWFNLMKLGAVGSAFLPDFYGEMTDLLNAGDRSDRFEVRWYLRSARALEAAAGSPAREPEAGGAAAILEAAGDPAAPVPVETGRAPGPGATVAIPSDYPNLRHADPALGARWREAAAGAFQACFDAGLVPLAVSRSAVYRFEDGQVT